MWRKQASAQQGIVIFRNSGIWGTKSRVFLNGYEEKRAKKVLIRIVHVKSDLFSLVHV